MPDDMHDDGEVMGRTVANPFREVVPVHSPAGGALVSIEQQRAVAEVQARMMIARANPRDPIRCMDLILQDCTRPTLAETALYQYSRGGSAISGPSIRLAESIARRWGNIASGIKELSRQNGYSECKAYAWDLESGYYDEREFQVRHWRDTKKGGYQLTDERDIYELIANMGQRRKRAVLLTVIPGDVVEAATNQCEETLKATADTSPDALKKMVQFFGAYGVTQAQIEARCQCHLEAIRPAQLVQLRKIYASLKDGMSEPDDWFTPLAPLETKPGAKLDRFEARHSPQPEPEPGYDNDGVEIPPSPAPTGGAPGADAPLAGSDPRRGDHTETAAVAGAATAQGAGGGEMSASPPASRPNHSRAGAEPADDIDRRAGGLPANVPAAQSDGRTVGSIPATGATNSPAAQPTGKDDANGLGGPAAAGEPALNPDPALIVRGDAVAAQGTDHLQSWWQYGLSALQRGSLGARGRGTGPYLESWKAIAAKADAAKPTETRQPVPTIKDNDPLGLGPPTPSPLARADAPAAPPPTEAAHAGSTAPASTDRVVPMPAHAEPDDVRGTEERGRTEIEPVMDKGKPDWRAWCIALFLPKLRQIADADALAEFWSDNAMHIEAAKAALGADWPDATVTAAWAKVGR